MATESVDEILTGMVENTLMFLTKDLPSLLDNDRVAKIRRVHKDQILQNLPEAKQRLEAYYTRECARKVLEGRLDENIGWRNAAIESSRRNVSRLSQFFGLVDARVANALPNLFDKRIAELRAAIQEMEGE